jgi:hypothetical protein
MATQAEENFSLWATGNYHRLLKREAIEAGLII